MLVRSGRVLLYNIRLVHAIMSITETLSYVQLLLHTQANIIVEDHSRQSSRLELDITVRNC